MADEAPAQNLTESFNEQEKKRCRFQNTWTDMERMKNRKESHVNVILIKKGCHSFTVKI